MSDCESIASGLTALLSATKELTSWVNTDSQCFSYQHVLEPKGLKPLHQQTPVYISCFQVLIHYAQCFLFL